MIQRYVVRSAIQKCKICGRKICNAFFDKESAIYKIMVEKDCCADCAYWENIIDNPPQHLEIIEQTAYDFQPYVEPRLGVILGETMWILRKDGKAVMSNDVWNKGKVPPAFCYRLPDTAYRVSKATYKKLLIGRVGCQAKGCFDRYHCYRYDYRSEFNVGPYNVVPKDWIVGNEKCPAFINLRDIKHFNYIDINDLLTIKIKNL